MLYRTLANGILQAISVDFSRTIITWGWWKKTKVIRRESRIPSRTDWDLVSNCFSNLSLFRCHWEYSGNHRSHQTSDDHVIDEQLSRCVSVDGHQLSALNVNSKHFTKSLLQKQIRLRHYSHDLSTDCWLLFEFECLANCDVHCRTMGSDHVSSAKSHLVYGASCSKDCSRRPFRLVNLYIAVGIRNEAGQNYRSKESLRFSRLYHANTSRTNGTGQ